MVDTQHFGFALRHQARQNQTGGGAQVGGHYRRTVEFFHTAHNCGIAFHFNIRPHALQFLHMHKAIFKYGFNNGAGALGDCIQGHKLRLHVGGKRRVRRGTHAYCFWTPTFHVQLNPVVTTGDFRAGLAQFIQHSIQ